MSLGGEMNQTLEQYIYYNSYLHSNYFDALTYAVNKGATVVIAAGNKKRDLDSNWVAYPAYMSEYIPGVISVGAVANTGQKAYYTNYGSKLTLGAPGGDFLSTGQMSKDSALLATSPLSPPKTQSNYQIDPLYGYLQGTSMAAPVVTGAIALIKEENPDLTPAEIELILQQSAKKFKDLDDFVRDGNYLDVEQRISILFPCVYVL